MTLSHHSLLALCLLCYSSLLPADFASEVDALFRPYDNPQVPGAAVLVLHNGQLLYQKAYGLAELETDRAVKESTNFRMASVSKQFTALSTLVLVDKKLLDLDETLQDVFPDFAAYGREITIRHLLHHISGIRDYEELLPGSGQVNDSDVVAILKRQNSTYFTPGSQYRYSNSGYCVLSQIVQVRAGIPYAQFVEENLFRPLGMFTSHVYERDSPPPIPQRAFGYTRYGSTFKKTDQSQTSATQGDGGIYTSVSEYARWARGLNFLVSPELAELLFTPGVLNNGSTISYGMGWSLGSAHGRKRYSHTGSTIGFRTAVELYPESDTAIAVFINRAASAPWDIASEIASKLFQQKILVIPVNSR
ncbi:MAG: beta-lactamase family protein [Bdellovibrionales bacterium]|nr:beta-lactamase family protein [Bdellovibrionales bacterium]